VRPLLGIVVVVWLVGSLYYSVNGFKTRRQAVAQLKDEKAGKYQPESVTVDAVLPRTLEERARAIAEAEARGEYDHVPEWPTGTAEAPGATTGTPVAPESGDAPASEAAEVTSTEPPAALPATEALAPPPPPAPAGPPQAAASGPAVEAMPSIFDAPAPPVEIPEGSGRPIVELLAGATLPCDLVPLIAAGEAQIDPRRIPFITRGHAPADVARQLRAVLEGIGFEMRPTGPMSATAISDAGVLEMTILDTPMSVFDGTQRRYPSAQVDSVVVELESR
jgi:hypothetical protein